MDKGQRKIWDVMIVGAGAAGMMAAITAARRGLSVLVLEHKDKPGKKILATGNGKCNFTNAYMASECFHGDAKLIASVLARFTHEDCLAFFHGLGICPKNKNGYYYPNSEQAASVADALVRELVRLHVTLVLGCQIESVQADKNGFVCHAKDERHRGKNLVFATGLLASPKLGSDGSAIPIIRALGHGFRPILPALCGFYCEGMDFRRVAGVRCDAGLTLLLDGITCGQERGELQLAEYGLSGIPVFQLSAKAVRGLDEGKKAKMILDFLPDFERQELLGELHARCARWHREAAEQVLEGLLHKKLIGVCLARTRIAGNTFAGKLDEEELLALCSVLKSYPVTMCRARETEFAQVCTGGIRSEEIDADTLESRICPGLYFAGELLDVDGICGGYNLQWAWSSGFVAGSSVR